MKWLAALVLCPGVAFSQVIQHEDSGLIMCTLTDAQTDASIEAFGKIVPVLTQEPRCVNCHGGVNPFIEGVGDPSDPAAARFEHGGGKMDKPVGTSKGTDCATCHSALAPKTDGTPSEWKLAPRQLSFMGKDPPTLCMQIREELFTGSDAVEHFQDDRGKDNFVGTAFMGNRGLSAEQYPEIAPQRPRISASALVNLARDWVAATDGVFVGSPACGCKPQHYAIRMTTMTEVKSGGFQMKSAMTPVDVPITFEDDGKFSGEAAVNFTGQSAAADCTGQYATSLNIRASGEAVPNSYGGLDMRLQLENTAPPVDSVSARCPRGGFSQSNVQSADPRLTVLKFDMSGNVGEFLIYQMPAVAGLSSKLRVEIVQLAEPAR